VLYSSSWAFPPGLTAAVETYEAAFRWGPAGLGLITGGTIDSACVDVGNSPTYELRPGLLLGQKTATGTWTNYSPTATDGSEVAAGVCITSIRMQDILTGAGASRFYGILVGGPVQAAKVLGLDLMARAQMADRFWFDDALNYPGCHWFPWKRFQTKTAAYQVTANDNFTLFDNTGATGSVTFTLPAIANGYYFGFRGAAAQTFAVTSSEGGNVIALNNLTASTLTYSTGSQQIGAMLAVFSNPAGTKWLAQNVGAGVAAVTVS
jgi:Bacteriophage lambda head decoration protein D